MLAEICLPPPKEIAKEFYKRGLLIWFNWINN